MHLCPSVLLHALRTFESVNIAAVKLAGGYAKEVAALQPNTRSIDLVSLWVHSTLFGGLVQQTYHPRILMTSCFVALRTMLLLRESIYLSLIFPGTMPIAVLFFRFAVYLGVEVDLLARIVNALSLDLAQPVAALVRLSQAIKDFVRLNSTGTHGAGRGGPRACRVVSSGAYTDQLMSAKVATEAGGPGEAARRSGQSVRFIFHDSLDARATPDRTCCIAVVMLNPDQPSRRVIDARGNVGKMRDVMEEEGSSASFQSVFEWVFQAFQATDFSFRLRLGVRGAE